MSKIISVVSQSLSNFRNGARPGRFAHLWDVDLSGQGLLENSDSPRPKQRLPFTVPKWPLRRVVLIPGFIVLALLFLLLHIHVRRPPPEEPPPPALDENGNILLGHSIFPEGGEKFWWQDFRELRGFFQGRHNIVPMLDYVPEQDGPPEILDQMPSQPVPLTKVEVKSPADGVECYLDSNDNIPIPQISAYAGLPQGMARPFLGSHKLVGLHDDRCYDRVNRLGPYGFGSSPDDLQEVQDSKADNGGIDSIPEIDWSKIRIGDAQARCVRRNSHRKRSRTAVIIRTWHTATLSRYQIMMLRAMITELSLASSGDYEIHFLVHVQNETLPIWADKQVYDEVLRESLPEEFRGMATLWSVPQMRLIYPPPFPDSIENRSGKDIYGAYRSLHFALQYFAYQHPEFDYFWQWELDMRVTGHYHELLQSVTDWAQNQWGGYLWERSAKFFIPSLFNGSYNAYLRSIMKEVSAEGKTAIIGPQLNRSSLLPIPHQDPPDEHTAEITDLITFNPLFDPIHTGWAFRNDITGYPPDARPPTRSALITVSRVSRRLLLLMHEETYRFQHSMFPEMYPASLALHYGLRALYAPLPVYLDRDWSKPPSNGVVHLDEIFNNARLKPDSMEHGMPDHGDGYFHGPGGSVFGPGEHVFRGSTYYSEDAFAGYLWRRWLGRENETGEIDFETTSGKGRMCLPMMVLHTVKTE